MIVNQMGGGTSGEGFVKKTVKEFGYTHSANSFKHPAVGVQLSKAVQAGEQLVVYGNVKTYGSVSTTDSLPSGNIYDGTYIIYIDGDMTRINYFMGITGRDTTQSTGGETVSMDYKTYYSPPVIEFTPDDWYGDSQGSTYVSKTEVWFTKE